jgi:site-specific recombinase XerD
MVAPRDLERLSVADAIVRYRDALARQVVNGALAERTVATYERDLADFSRIMGADTILDDVTGEDLERALVQYRGEPDRRRKNPDAGSGRSPRTTFRFRRSISRFFSYATTHMFVQRNPVDDMMSTKQRTDGALATHRTALSTQAAKSLVTVTQQRSSKRTDQDTGLRDEIIVRMLIEVGLRVSELCSLNRSDVYQEDGVTWVRVQGKGGKQRTVPLATSTSDLLWHYLQSPTTTSALQGDAAHHHHPEGTTVALFLSYRGNRLSARDIQRLMKRLTDELPPTVRRSATPHALRHTMATLALASGAADVAVVQRMLGHASLATTGMYLDEIRDELVLAVQANPVTGGAALPRNPG